MFHNCSVWREPQAGEPERPVGALWVKCRCGWTAYGKTYEDIRSLVQEHRDDAERNEELEREEAQHA